MIKKIAIVILILIAALLAYAATKPDTFRIERTTRIDAPPEKIAPLIQDFHQWPSWSPYEKVDPNMKRSYSGAPSGQGAVYTWDGNAKAGAGRMEILESTPQRIVIKLDFSKPFEGHNTAEFLLVPDGNATNVTWAMHGPNTYLSKVIGTVMSMDRMVGDYFETGLASLKALAERT